MDNKKTESTLRQVLHFFNSDQVDVPRTLYELVFKTVNDNHTNGNDARDKVRNEPGKVMTGQDQDEKNQTKFAHETNTFLPLVERKLDQDEKTQARNMASIAVAADIILLAANEGNLPIEFQERLTGMLVETYIKLLE